MPWVKLDDQFFSHPKVLTAGGDAALLYLAGLCYCQAHLTDGVIPAVAVPRLTDRRNSLKLAEKLIESRLWERHDQGYLVHDYHDHNDESEKVKAKRAATKNRVAEWRGKHARNSVTEQECNTVTNAPVTLPPSASASATASATSKDNAASKPAAVAKGRSRSVEAPMPFTITQAMDAIRHGVLTDPFPREPKYAKNLTALIRTYPDIVEWRKVADHLAAKRSDKPNLSLFISQFGAWRQEAMTAGPANGMHNDSPPGDEEPAWLIPPETLFELAGLPKVAGE